MSEDKVTWAKDLEVRPIYDVSHKEVTSKQKRMKNGHWGYYYYVKTFEIPKLFKVTKEHMYIELSEDIEDILREANIRNGFELDERDK